MSEYGQFMDESIATLDRILGKESQGSQGSQGLEGSGPQGSSSQGEGSNINDLTNLFHFLLLDKVDVKIKDKLTAVYKIFRSNSVPQLASRPPSGPSPPSGASSS